MSAYNTISELIQKAMYQKILQLQDWADPGIQFMSIFYICYLLNHIFTLCQFVAEFYLAPVVVTCVIYNNSGLPNEDKKKAR